MQPETSPLPANTKIGIHPFKQFKQGASNFFKHNAKPGAVAILILGIVNIGLSVLLAYAAFLLGVQFFIFALFSGAQARNILPVIGIGILIAVVYAVINGYFGLVLNRLILTGSRGESITLSSAFSFASKRIITAVLTYLLIFGILLIGIVVIGLSTIISPIISVVLSIAGIIVFIIFLLRISYVLFILADDEPISPLQSLKRSDVLWRKSSGALFVYWLISGAVILAVSFALSSATSNIHNSAVDSKAINYESFNANSIKPKFNIGLGSTVVSSFVTNFISALTVAGAATIYFQAKSAVDGTPPSSSTISSGGPLPPEPLNFSPEPTGTAYQPPSQYSVGPVAPAFDQPKPLSSTDNTDQNFKTPDGPSPS